VKAADQIDRTNIAFRQVFASPDGKTVLEALLAVFGHDYTHRDTNATQLAIQAGERNVINHIQQRIKHAVD
jgi:hypothetical protein